LVETCSTIYTCNIYNVSVCKHLFVTHITNAIYKFVVIQQSAHTNRCHLLSAEQSILKLQTLHKINTVMLFGHNPDLSSLANFLCDFTEGNLPTCGTVCIDFDSDTWTNIGEDKGTLRFYEHPKMYFK